MGLGKTVRLNRIFRHPSRRLCSVALDHFLNYQGSSPAETLNDVPSALERLMPAEPSAVTITKGVALACWPHFAGKVPLIIQAGCFSPDDRVAEITTTAAECARLGADAIAVAIKVRGADEGRSLRFLCDMVTEAAALDMPVIAHIYPRVYTDGKPRIVFTPEEIAWAARCGLECGADVIKIGYTGDVASYSQIVRQTSVPVIAAGGPRCATLELALETMDEAVKAGAVGATIGRNVWGHADPAAALTAFKSVVLDRVTPAAACAGLERKKQHAAQ